MQLIEKQEFYNTLTEKHIVLDSYQKLINNTVNKLFFESSLGDFNDLNDAVSINLFPSFFTPTFRLKEGVVVKTVPQKKINGYAIVIKEKTDVDSFLRTEYSKSFRSNIKRFVNRLETCFDIKYKMFYGEISDEDYRYYMSILKKMLINRFQQRDEKNNIIENWEFYYNSTLKMIHKKQASIFVIYDKEQPIHVCINHHFNNLFFVSIPSYDLNYSKFALGNISIYKLLEWALNNDYTMVDMAYGDLEYKRRWSNLIYSFNHHVIFSNRNFVNRVKASIEVNIIKSKNILKQYNIDEKIKRIKSYLRKSDTFIIPDFTIENDVSIDKNDFIMLKSLDNEDNFLKKLVFDFQFKTKAHSNDITIYKSKTLINYFVESKATNQKISFK